MSRTNFKGCTFREREAPGPGLFGLILVDKRKASAFMFLTFVFLLIKSPIFLFSGLCLPTLFVQKGNGGCYVHVG